MADQTQTIHRRLEITKIPIKIKKFLINDQIQVTNRLNKIILQQIKIVGLVL